MKFLSTVKTVQSAARILQANRPLEWGKTLELADAYFAFRILIGRNPTSAELRGLTRLAGSVTARQFLGELLASPEYQTQTRFLPPGYELVSDKNGFLFRFRTDDREMGVPMAMGIYEPDVTATVRALASQCRTMVDCGANTGFFTCTFLSAAGPDARVFAFEPMPECNELLRANVELNGFTDRVEIHTNACGRDHGEIVMSALPHLLVGCAVEGTESRVVKVLPLDDVINERVDLIKLDIEGAEPMALRGMQRVLSESRPILITELNEYWLRSVSQSSCREYVSQIESAGYRVVSAAPYARGERTPLVLPKHVDPLFVSEVVCLPD